jgi:hypothetical protein
MSPRAAIVLAVLALGCQPEIGDPCQTAADCTTSTDRICDATQPGGYCTIFNCEPGGCPEEAACVAFRAFPAVAPGCLDEQQRSRLERTFCMKRCGSDGDCRSGYACLDLASFDPEENPWAAQVIDAASTAVCAVPYSGPQPADAREEEVCSAGPALVGDAAGTAVPADAAVDGGG